MTDDDVIRVLLTRVARPHRSGAALLASGAGFGALISWIHAQGGRSVAPPAHSERGPRGARHAPGEATPMRYILPTGALDRAAAGVARGQETP